MTALLLKATSATITDTSMARAVRDPIVNPGSLFAFDLSRTDCIDLTQAISEGQAIANLVDNAPAATIKSVAGLTAVAGKGLQLGAGSAQGRIQIDAGTSYFQTNLTDDFLLIGWANYPASNPGGHIGLLLQKHTSSSYSAPGPSLARTYGTSNNMIGKMDASTGNGSIISRPAPSGSMQEAIAKIGSNLLFYENGVQVGSVALGTPALTANSTPLTFGNNTGTGYAPQGLVLNAAYAEDLTISAAASGKTTAAQALAQVALDYTTRSGKF